MKKTKLIALCIAVCMVFAFSACTTEAEPAAADAPEEAAPAADTAEEAAPAAEDEAAAEESAEASGERTYMLAPDGKGDGERKIGATVIIGVSPHVQAWIDGVRDVVESHGDEFVVLDPNFDTLVQAQNVDDLVAAGCDGIVIETIDGEALVSSVEKAVDAGVFVTSSDLPFSESNQHLIVSQAMSNNYDGGYMVGKRMCEDLGGEGKVILFYYPGQGSAEREEGMRAAIAEYPGVEIVADGDGGGDIEQANTLMQNLMQAHPDLDAVIATNDHGAIGALTALKSAGRLEGVGIYGFDAVPETMDYIEAGEFHFSVRQDPYMMGYMSATDLYAAMNGEPIGAAIKRVPTEPVDASNYTEYGEYDTSGREYDPATYDMVE